MFSIPNEKFNTELIKYDLQVLGSWPSDLLIDTQNRAINFYCGYSGINRAFTSWARNSHGILSTSGKSNRYSYQILSVIPFHNCFGFLLIRDLGLIIHQDDCLLMYPYESRKSLCLVKPFLSFKNSEIKFILHRPVCWSFMNNWIPPISQNLHFFLHYIIVWMNICPHIHLNHIRKQVVIQRKQIWRVGGCRKC